MPAALAARNSCSVISGWVGAKYALHLPAPVYPEKTWLIKDTHRRDIYLIY